MISFHQKIYKHRELISFLIGLIGLVFGLAQYFFPYNQRTSIKFFLRDEINVVSVSSDIEKLNIYFNNRDIKKDSLNLRIFKIRLKNDGDKSISEKDFASIPFGLKVVSGSLIFVKLKSSNEYLNNNINPTIVDSTEIHLNKCILDEGDFIDFEILAIHKLNKAPELIPLGKVANLEGISLERGNDEDKIGLMSSALALIVLAGIFLSFVLILFGSFWIIETLRRFFRKKSILSFFDYPITTLNSEQKVIVNIITERGFKTFSKFTAELKQNTGNYKEIYLAELSNKEAISKFKSLVKDKKYYCGKSANNLNEYDSAFLSIINELEKNGLTNEEKKVSDAFLIEADKVVVGFK
jgi:hypothetical protein